jgi:hypothetical protein
MYTGIFFCVSVHIFINCYIILTENKYTHACKYVWLYIPESINSDNFANIFSVPIHIYTYMNIDVCSLGSTEKCLGLYMPEMFCSNKCIYIYVNTVT